MPVVWIPLADAVRRALEGMIHNSPAVAGILAAYAASADGFAALRPADAPEALTGGHVLSRADSEAVLVQLPRPSRGGAGLGRQHPGLLPA